jgi:hypothetical protein
MNRVCVTNKPNISSLGKELVKEQFFNTQKMKETLKNFNFDYLNLNYFEETIYRIVQNYDSFFDVEFLKAIVFNYSFSIDVN